MKSIFGHKSWVLCLGKYSSLAWTRHTFSGGFLYRRQGFPAVLEPQCERPEPFPLVGDGHGYLPPAECSTQLQALVPRATVSTRRRCGPCSHRNQQTLLLVHTECVSLTLHLYDTVQISSVFIQQPESEANNGGDIHFSHCHASCLTCQN